MESAMSRWRMAGEPDLEELLGDEVMTPVVRSAGVSHEELRRQLSDIGRRLARRAARTEPDYAESGYDAAFWELRARR
jgi:hypothetical protein